MAGTPTFSLVSVTQPRGGSGLSMRLREVPPSTEYFHQNNRSFLRPPNLSKRESFPFKELNFQKLKFAVLSNLSLFTFSFITSTKLAQFQIPIPFLESALNLLSHGVVSCSIMFTFDIATIQNRFTFGENLRKYFRKKKF